jgi:hypothetical protein
VRLPRMPSVQAAAPAWLLTANAWPSAVEAVMERTGMISRAAAPGLSDRHERVRHARLLPVGDRDKDVEILALRHQITVLRWHRRAS